jgi:UDP-N-acetylglucosamine--N-acetylmuramyl-(pentapeptide) pyrophosphoryl-undecaprenol N-acetylglucosamine transferase
VDDHQTRNADFLVAAGAAVLMPQAELTPELLAQEIDRCVGNRQILEDRAARARSVARPNATREVVEVCLAVGHGS